MPTPSKILLIEDDKKKIDDIRDFIEDFLTVKLTIRQSYQTGLRELMANEYQLLLLDMSIPMWDSGSLESSSNFEKFGGYLILNEIVRKGRGVKTILITMFDDFGESDSSVTLKQINSHLKEEFSEIYLGAIFYSAREAKWKDELRQLLLQE